MASDLWNQMIPRPHEAEVSGALERVRGRSLAHRAGAARRRRALVLAAGFALTFAAGWMAGHASAGGGQRARTWALSGQSIEEGRATFVAVPASDR